MTTKGRVTLTVHLNPQKDADLIKALDGLTGEARGSRVRSALRRGLKLREAMPANTPVIDDARVQQLESDLESYKAWVQQWVDYIQTRFDTLTLPAIPAQPQVETVERISAERKEKRTQNLLKRGW